jgi:hypothetical protein
VYSNFANIYFEMEAHLFDFGADFVVNLRLTYQHIELLKFSRTLSVSVHVSNGVLLQLL